MCLPGEFLAPFWSGSPSSCLSLFINTEAGVWICAEKESPHRRNPPRTARRVTFKNTLNKKKKKKLKNYFQDKSQKSAGLSLRAPTERHSSPLPLFLETFLFLLPLNERERERKRGISVKKKALRASFSASFSSKCVSSVSVRSCVCVRV